MEGYATEALARAIAPVNLVIESFLNDVSEQSLDGLSAQERFVSMVISVSRKTGHDETESTGIHEIGRDWKSIDFLPSRRYVHKLVLCYTSRLDKTNIELEDDNLASLVCHFSMSRCSNLPDPTLSCIANFRIPVSSNTETMNTDNDIVGIRTYPHHNDVGVAKLWEAGGCLAEYIMLNPQCVRGRNVVELGAGVGLTGLVAAGVAKAKSVHMTDYTEVCLDNLAYNVCENKGWLTRRGISPETVTVGKLEWGDYSREESENQINGHVHGYPWASSTELLSKADVLIAADVVYIQEVIPDLVATVSKFLSQMEHCNGTTTDKRMAIFATTFRNKATFGMFEKELVGKNIECTHDHSLEDLPNIFPCYYNQPRSDVRVCTMRLKQ